MDFIKLDVQDNIAYLTLDRAPANAFNYQMYRELRDTFNIINERKDIFVTIINATGRFFSAGNDVNDFDVPPSLEGEETATYGEMVEAGLSSVIKSPKPVICVVEGTAVGSGFCVVTYSDIVLATPNAKFGITEVKVGIVGGAPEASFSLPPKVVRYMALTGSLLTAQEAEEYGMVLKVVEKDQIMDEAKAIAEKILNNPPLTVSFMKQSLYNIYRPDVLAQIIDLDGEMTQKSKATKDFKEAVTSFLEKRKPKYLGE